MVNGCEPAINLISPDMPKMLTGMSQNGTWAVFGLGNAKAWTESPSGNNRHLTFLLSPARTTVSPHVHPPGQADRKVVKPVNAIGVVTNHPITQGLAVHTSRP